MRAVVYTGYGSPNVLQIQEVEKPVPGDGEVQVKVYAVSINAVDYQMLRGRPALTRFALGGYSQAKEPGTRGRLRGPSGSGRSERHAAPAR